MSEEKTEDALWTEINALAAEANKAMAPDASDTEMQQVATYFTATCVRARTILEAKEKLEALLKPALKSKPRELPEEIRKSYMDFTVLVRDLGYGTRDEEAIAADNHRWQEVRAYSHGIKLPLQNMSLAFGGLIEKITTRNFREAEQQQNSR